LTLDELKAELKKRGCLPSDLRGKKIELAEKLRLMIEEEDKFASTTSLVPAPVTNSSAREVQVHQQAVVSSSSSNGSAIAQKRKEREAETASQVTSFKTTVTLVSQSIVESEPETSPDDISDKFKALLLALEFLLKSRTVPTFSRVCEGVRNICGYDLTENDLRTILSVYPNIVEVQWVNLGDKSSTNLFELSVSAYTSTEQRSVTLSQKLENFK
jgi:hypothetical protein